MSFLVNTLFPLFLKCSAEIILINIQWVIPENRSIPYCVWHEHFNPSLPSEMSKCSTGMMQWWECSPPTNVSWVLFPDPALYVGWVCCWFSSLSRGFSPGTPVFPSLQKPTFPNSNSIWIIVEHFIMSLSLGWSCKHFLCLTLNLHFTPYAL